MRGILNPPGLRELDKKESETEYHVKAEPASIARLCPHCGELHRSQRHGYTFERLRAKVLFTDRLQKRVPIQEKVKVKKQRFEGISTGRMTYFMMPGMFDDYEVKIKTRLDNVGTDLPTLLALWAQTTSRRLPTKTSGHPI